MGNPYGPGDFFEGKIFNHGFICFNINRITDIFYFCQLYESFSHCICAF